MGPWLLPRGFISSPSIRHIWTEQLRDSPHLLFYSTCECFRPAVSGECLAYSLDSVFMDVFAELAGVVKEPINQLISRKEERRFRERGEDLRGQDDHLAIERDISAGDPDILMEYDRFAYRVGLFLLRSIVE
jgi:hypothetical protein